MRILNINGVLPTIILENTAPWEWSGGVGLLEDTSIVRFVEVEGFAGNFFDATLDRRTGFITITPSARMDYEWFAETSQSTSLTLNLRFFLTDGTQAVGSRSFTVSLLDLDDTPPEALSFATGGRVRAGVPGAEIGRLAVSDRDTASGFTFQLAEMDDWQFEVVGGVLKLREGISVSLGDGPQRKVTVLVSDGRQESAFTLAFDVLPGANLPQQPANFLLRGDARNGFSWGGPDSAFFWTPADAVVGYVPVWDINAITTAGGHVRVELKTRESLIFDKPSMMDIASGTVDFRADSHAASLWLLWETLLDRAPTLTEYQEGVWHLATGLTPRAVVDHLLTIGDSGRLYMRLDNTQFVREIYSNVIAWDIGPDVVNWHASRLNQGIISRTDFVLDIVDWRRSLADFQGEVSDGFYVPRRHISQIGAALDVAAGLELGEFAFYWAWFFETGAWTYRDMGIALMNTDAARQKWAGVPDREFFLIVTREIFDIELPAEHLAWWEWAVAAGVKTHGDFIGLLAQAMPNVGSFRALPQGAMFDAIW